MPPLFVPILAQVLTLSAQDSTSVRARTSGDEIFYDADTRPSVDLGLDGEHTSFSIGYAPVLTLDSLGPDAELAILHAGSAFASMRSRHHFLTLGTQGGYGRQNFLSSPIEDSAGLTDPTAPPLPTAPPAGQSREVNEVIEYGYSTSTLSLIHVLTRRLVMSELAGYDTSSGFDDLARSVFPLQREVFGGLTFGYSLTRSDTLFTQGDGRYVITGPIAALVVGAAERWAKRWSPGVSTELGAGAAYTANGPRDAPESELERRIFPTATGALRITRGQIHRRDSFTLSSSLAPDVDRTTGAIDQRVSWQAESEHTQGHATFTISTLGSQSLDNNTDNSLTSINVGALAAYAFTDELSLELGISTTWQNFAGADNLPLFWSGGLGVNYAIEPIRF